jgi:uncharacterized membrane protein
MGVMRDMMDGGGMMWGMGTDWLILTIVVVLVIIALVKHIFFREESIHWLPRASCRACTVF